MRLLDNDIDFQTVPGTGYRLVRLREFVCQQNGKSIISDHKPCMAIQFQLNNYPGSTESIRSDNYFKISAPKSPLCRFITVLSLETGIRGESPNIRDKALRKRGGDINGSFINRDLQAGSLQFKQDAKEPHNRERAFVCRPQQN